MWVKTHGTRPDNEFYDIETSKKIFRTMNKSITTLLLLAALLCLAACSNMTIAARKLQHSVIAWNAGDQLAVARLGYFQSEQQLKASRHYAHYTGKYGLAASTPVVKTECDEAFLVIVRDPKARVTVHKLTFDMVAGGEPPATGEVLYQGDGGTPFFLICNISDVYPNTCLRVVSSTGIVTEYSPRISLREGELQLPDSTAEGQGSVLDITDYWLK